MPWIFDLGVVVLLVCCAFNGYRHGFVKTVVRLAGSLLAMLLSGALARALTGVVTTAVRQPLLDYVRGKLGDLVDVSPVVAVQGVYESLPVAVKQAFFKLDGKRSGFRLESNWKRTAQRSRFLYGYDFCFRSFNPWWTACCLLSCFS